MFSLALRATKPSRRALPLSRGHIHTPRTLQDDRWARLTNILADDVPPPVQVKAISNAGIELEDGLIIPSACIFLEGKVFLWDVPSTLWQGWSKDRFEIFDLVVPKPEILLLGTGKSVVPPPALLRHHLTQLGIQVDIMDSWNACTTYNLLSEEGRRVAAALLPYSPRPWKP
ncbi:NADH dehydrogenase 1 alpha subcomplex assembly factor 3 [Amylostereum chailletii]|nr:NADH dehydrogenase 1 alpha subcomplex assembly factor 3 [Amylostereum chailletii]